MLALCKFCSLFKSVDVIHESSNKMVSFKMMAWRHYYILDQVSSLYPRQGFFNNVLDKISSIVSWIVFYYSLSDLITTSHFQSFQRLYIIILAWDTERKALETLLSETMGTKSRTASCYSLIGMAVKYIYDANQQTFLELGHPWEEMVEEFFPGRFRDAVRLTHPEISRPDLLLKNFLRDLISYASELTISQRKRKLCLAETMKTGTRQAVLGIRISEFRILNGIALDQIQKVLIEFLLIIIIIYIDFGKI